MACHTHSLGLTSRLLLTFFGLLLSASLLWAAPRVSEQGALKRPEFSGKDRTRPTISVTLHPRVGNLNQPTDAVFLNQKELLLLEKAGRVWWIDLDSGASRELLRLDLTSHSEQGLLGIALHPRFSENQTLFLNTSTTTSEGSFSFITEWKADRSTDPARLTRSRTVMQVAQPYSNHNAGGLAFGPDGYLYIGWGDGGAADDPLEQGQDPSTALGSLLRIDINRTDRGKGYAVPADNPFVGHSGFLPEVWAWGFRNPWRLSFGPQGELLVADVGQNEWEEVAWVLRGDNHGWNLREGRHCFRSKPGCTRSDLADPIFEYDHSEGRSITGGFVWTGPEAALSGKYVFGDFGSGRLWALDLPESPQGTAQASALGKWPIMPSTFVPHPSGSVWVADFRTGTLLEIVP